jgi:photosystem II stability/assembly factor-like uncharacterized protein
MFHPIRAHRLVQAVAVACALFHAPVSAARKAEPPPPPATGMVVMTANFASARASPHFDQYHSFSIIPVELNAKGKPQDAITSQFAIGDARGTFSYTVVAPVGRYRLHRVVGTYYMGDATYTTWIELGDLAPEFDIKADTVLDAGSVVVLPLGRRFIIARLPTAPGVLDHVLTADPRDDSARFRGRPVETLGEIKAEVTTVFGAMQANAALNGPFHRTQDGRLLAPGKLGQLMRAEEDGRLTTRSTGIGYNLRSVSEDRKGGLLVGAEFGTILRAPTLFDEWRQVRLPTGAGVVYAVAEAADGNLIAISEWDVGPVAKTGFWSSPIGQSGRLYRTPTLRVWRITPDGSASVIEEVVLANDLAYNAFSDGHDLVLATGAKRMGRWDGTAGTWSWSTVPVDHIERNLDGSWFGSEGKRTAIFISNKPFISLDRGKTWKEVLRGTDRTIRVKLEGPVIQGDAPGVLFAVGRAMRNQRKTWGIYVTTDHGITWTRDATSTQLCGEAVDRLVQDGQRTWMVCEWYRVYGRETPSSEWVVQRELQGN